MSPEFGTSRRRNVIEKALKYIQNKARTEETEGARLLKSKSNYDGPMQSKQPDEMIKLEYRVSLHQHQHLAYRDKANQLQDLLEMGSIDSSRISSGSVFVWGFEDAEESENKNEVVIVIPSGGGEFENFRLLSEVAPLAQSIMGSVKGDIVKLGGITITIKDIL